MTRKEKLKRRRRKRLFRRIRQGLFVFACFMLVFAVLHGIYNFIRFHDASDAEKQVLTHTKDYPDALIALMKTNEETQQFVADYTKYGNHHFKILLTNDVKKGTIPYFCQWDKRWGYESYDDNYFAITGSAPTCLSMISVGLSNDLNANPLMVARYMEEHNFLTKNHKTKVSFFTDGAQYFDIIGKKLTITEEKMKQQLKAKKPMIAQVGKGDFTTSNEHYIVIYGIDKKGNFLIHDPNSIKNSNKSWSFETLQTQLKQLWYYQLL